MLSRTRMLGRGTNSGERMGIKRHLVQREKKREKKIQRCGKGSDLEASIEYGEGKIWE